MKKVYFIKPVGMPGPIKIGCSRNPSTRRASLSTWSPFALEILAEIDGDTNLERRFHARFIHLHERREWFTAAPDLMAVIADIAAGEFDIDTLPEGKFVANRNVKARPAYFGKQLSYSLRVSHMVRRTGFACKTDTYNMIRDDDQGRIAAADAYLAAPHLHGEPINATWAIECRKSFMSTYQPADKAA